jgi:uncharacterized protein GlcG (DUF336 family)
VNLQEIAFGQQNRGLPMRHKVIAVLTGTATLLLTTSFVLADDAAPLPGDHGRMMGGIFPANPPPRPPGAMQQPATPAPPIALAVKAAEAVAKACSQYKLGVAVVNSKGEPILVYLPDGSGASHGFTAARKAYTAITFQVPTSELVIKGQQDADFAAKIKADPNLMAFKGGIPLKTGGQIVGAIGVSGAEPGGHDEECALKGVAAIKDQLN